MKKLLVAFTVLATITLLTSSLSATPVSAEVLFSNTGALGSGGRWTVNFTTGAPVTLTSITINLGGTLIFDTYTGSSPANVWGTGGAQDYLPISGTVATGATAPSTGYAYESAASAPGPQSFTVNFSDFAMGESFVFDLDIDDDGSASGVLPSALVSSASSITFGFGGGFSVSPSPSTASFVLLSPTVSRAQFNGESAFIPEPGTYALFGGGLLLIGLLRQKARRKQ